jgi:hypothetical protein
VIPVNEISGGFLLELSGMTIKVKNEEIKNASFTLKILLPNF